MSVRTIRATLYFKTPNGGLCKHVNWSHYESKAMLTTSTTSSEAFNRFFINAQRIINASKSELQYLDTIWFYEERKQRNGTFKQEHCTETLKVGKDMKLEVIS